MYYKNIMRKKEEIKNPETSVEYTTQIWLIQVGNI